MIQMTFTLLLLCATVARGALVQRPKNLAVSVGGSSYFNCSNDDSRAIDWVFSPDIDLLGLNGILMTDSSCNIIANFSENFRTEKPSSTVCNLIVFNANLQLGGYYACQSVTTYKGILVIADTTSSTVTNNVTEVIEGCEDDVFFEMTVKYSGPLPMAPTPPSSVALPPLYPSLKWALKSDPANAIPSSETVTNTTSSSHIIVTATVPSVSSYVCTLYFKTPTNLPTNIDSTAPNFTFSWNTSATDTSCNALNASSISVTPHVEEPSICEAKILECHPYAYPLPHDVHWLDVIRNETFNGTRITAEFGGEYVCSVTNIIKGNNYTASVTHKLNDDSASTMDKCKGVSGLNVTVSMTNRSEITSAETRKEISRHSNSNAYSSRNVTGNTTEATMTCTADGLPNPTYAWYSSDCQDQEPISKEQQIKVFASSSYECVARNSINDRKFNKSITIKLTLSGDEPVVCQHLEPVVTSEDCEECLLLLILLVLVLFVFPACAFLLWYGCSKSCRENVNEKYLWIEKALPCMNGKGCQCSGGMVLFVFCLVICGIIFVPWILIASHCCKKNSKHSQGNSISLHERNGSKNGRHQSGASPQSMSNSTGEAPSHAPPPTPSSIHLTQADPFRNSHVNYPPSRPPPSSRAMHSPSPVSASAVEYGELKIDSKPGSRKPLEPIIQNESAYAELHTS